MKSMLTPIGVSYIVAGCIHGCVALLFFVYALFPALVGVAAISGTANDEEGALPALVIMAISTIGLGGLGAIFGILGITYLIDGIGIIRRKRWSRVLGVVLAIPMLGLCMPIGTVIAVMAMVALLSAETQAEFAT